MAERSLRSRYLAARDAPHRGELAAGAAVAALLVHALLAQVTLALAICFVVTGRLTRWRPLWLAVPAVAGLAWMLTIGIRPAVAGYLAGAGQVFSYLAGPGSALTRLAHLYDAFSGWRQWLPRQLPVALIAAAAEAAGLHLLRRSRQGQRYRTGVIIAIRRRYLTASIRRGEVATSDGGCVGVALGTGRRAAISWREAESGVLCTGQDATAVTATGLELAAAAIQRRKTVIIIDLAGRDASSADGRGRRGGRGNGTGSPAASVALACADAGAPLSRFGDPGGCYEPARGTNSARAAALVLAMIDWTGVSHAQQRFCADYLDAALAVIAATAAATAGPAGAPTAVLDDLAGLLRPDALRSRLGHVPGYLPALDGLAGRVTDLSGQLEADPAAVTPVASQLAGLRSAALGHWLRPARTRGPAGPAGPAGLAGLAASASDAGRAGSGWFAGSAGQEGQRGAADETPISLGQALTDRGVVLFPLDRRVHGQPAAMIARLVTAELIAILAERRALAAPGDCLVWINGCEALDPRQLTALIGLGAGTGTAVVLGTTADRAAARLASETNVVVVRGPASPALAGLLGDAGGGASGSGSGVGAQPHWPPSEQSGQLLPGAITAGAPGWPPGQVPGQITPGAVTAGVPGLPPRFSFDPEGSAESTADVLRRQRPDAVSLMVRNPRPRVLVHCRAVR